MEVGLIKINISHSDRINPREWEGALHEEVSLVIDPLLPSTLDAKLNLGLNKLPEKGGKFTTLYLF